MMKTKITMYGSGDQYDGFFRILCVGENIDAARQQAISSMRHGCQDDFTRPSTIHNGYYCAWGVVDAVMLESGEDVDDLPFGIVTDPTGYPEDSIDIDVMEFEGHRFALSRHFSEDFDTISSKQLREEEMRNYYDQEDDDE